MELQLCAVPQVPVFETLDLLHIISSYRLYMQWFLPVPGDDRPVTSCDHSRDMRVFQGAEGTGDVRREDDETSVALAGLHGSMGPSALMIHWILRFLLGLNPTVSQGPGALGLPWFTQLQRLKKPPAISW